MGWGVLGGVRPSLESVLGGFGVDQGAWEPSKALLTSRTDASSTGLALRASTELKIRGSPDCAVCLSATLLCVPDFSTTRAWGLTMTVDFPSLGWRRLALLAALLPAACASPDDEPVPQPHAPHLVLTNPAVVEQDTVVTGQAGLYVQGSYDERVSGTLAATVSEEGRASRALAPPTGIRPNFTFLYQPATTAVRRVRLDAQLTDKYTQVSSQGFWLRLVPLPTPTVNFTVAMPTTVAPGSAVTVRAVLRSTIDPPAELRLYRFEYVTGESPRLTLLGMVGEAALLAARQGSVTAVDLPAFVVPASAVPFSTINLLLFARTRHRMQAQSFYNLQVQP